MITEARLVKKKKPKKHKFQFHQTSNCNVEETVEHFILDCSGSKSDYVNYHNANEMNYNIRRSKFRKDLSNIAIVFKQEKNFNIINLLFPNIWQKDPEKTDPNYYNIKERKTKREIDILKCVVRFVQHTRRFKKEKYGI